jgi:gluconokinase
VSAPSNGGPAGAFCCSRARAVAHQLPTNLVARRTVAKRSLLKREIIGASRIHARQRARSRHPEREVQRLILNTRRCNQTRNGSLRYVFGRDANTDELSAIVVMGPSGCGKTTLAKALARALGWRFIEGDEHHPPGNIAKMQAGEPLTEEDRVPFLTSIGRELASAIPAVASCSALQGSHRDILRSFVENILFVWPRVDEEELARRVENREGHFMAPSLLQSQISSLEPPSAAEISLTIDGSLSLIEQVQAVLQHL